MKKAILSLCIAAMTAASLTLPASAADLMTFRFGAEKTAVSTDELVAKDLGVDWDKAYHEREQIKKLWSEKVTQ